MYDKVWLHFLSLLTIWSSTLSAPVCFTNKPSNTKVGMLLHLVLAGNSNYLQEAWPYPHPIIPIETPSQSFFPSFPIYFGTFFGTAKQKTAVERKCLILAVYYWVNWDEARKGFFLKPLEEVHLNEKQNLFLWAAGWEVWGFVVVRTLVILIKLFRIFWSPKAMPKQEAGTGTIFFF